MNTSPALVTVMLLFMLERAHGNSVTQKQDRVMISEDEFLFINCTYSTTGYPTLYWYVQYPREGPQLLLKVTTANNKGSSRGFEATYDKETTSFHLQKASVQESDSAVYYCALDDTVAETTGGAEYKLREAKGSLTSDHLPLHHPVYPYWLMKIIQIVGAEQQGDFTISGFS